MKKRTEGFHTLPLTNVSSKIWENNGKYVNNQSEVRTRYLGQVTGYQPIRDQYFKVRSVPGNDNKYLYNGHHSDEKRSDEDDADDSKRFQDPFGGNITCFSQPLAHPQRPGDTQRCHGHNRGFCCSGAEDAKCRANLP